MRAWYLFSWFLVGQSERPPFYVRLLVSGPASDLNSNNCVSRYVDVSRQALEFLATVSHSRKYKLSAESFLVVPSNSLRNSSEIPQEMAIKSVGTQTDDVDRQQPQVCRC